MSARVEGSHQNNPPLRAQRRRHNAASSKAHAFLNWNWHLEELKHKQP
jgi:hypothetical protein